VRCKACNSKMLDGEIVWYEDEKRHEDMCLKCRNIVRELENEQGTDILYPDDNFDDIIKFKIDFDDE